MIKRTIIREIKGSLGRYIAILAIVALGVGFFAGLKVTRQAMVSTADEYIQKQNFYDYQLLSGLGFEEKDIENIQSIHGVKYTEGSISSDVMINYDKAVDKVTTVISIPKNVNKVQLSAGHMPKNSDECIVDSRMYSKKHIGQYIELSEENSSDTLQNFAHKKYKIVGICQSPLYLNFERGTSALGGGSVSGFFYINKDGFKMDYFTSLYIKCDTSSPIYSEQYKNYISDNKNTFKDACKSSANRRYDSVISEAKEKLAKEEKKYNDSLSDFKSEKQSAYAKLSSSYNKIESGFVSIRSAEKQLLSKEKQLQDTLHTVNDGFSQLKVKKSEFEANKQYMTDEQIAETEATLSQTETTLTTSKGKVLAGQKKIAESKELLKVKETDLNKGLVKYKEGKAEADKKFAEAQLKLEDGKKQLEKAQKKIDKIKKADTYVLTRDENIGYVCFENDSEIVNAIAKVFPVFFFLVAALVCMTTMTRMVDEQRTQIGVLKALGYSNGAVMGKFMVYSGSAAFLGASIGFLSLCYVFPAVIWRAYGMMYDFSGSINYVFNWNLAALSLVVALICSIGATWFSCANEFRIVPAELIRPKSPKTGKKILLEYVKPIWSKLSFLYKVSLRNIFRYKKRLLMMVLGISGCTALLVTGFGVNDSIKNIVDFQYDEIFTYDYSVTFTDNQSDKNKEEFINNTKDYADSVLFVHEGSVDYVGHGKSKQLKLVSSDSPDFNNFIDLHSKSSAISYPKDGEIVISEKLSKEFDITTGDTITLRNSDHKTMKVKVSGICQNYIYNYVYITPQTYKDGWGEYPELKTAYVNTVSNSAAKVSQAAADTQNQSYVAGTNVNNDMRNRVNSMMTSLNAVILLIVLSAGALAFIVLYNLTNINITERIREIATIKVLGFYPKETSAYIFRENFFLTGISAVVGLFLGKWLHAFAIDQIRIDMIFFDNRITPMSYIISIILTFVFAAIVSIFMYFKLKRVSMTESLKSIE